MKICITGIGIISSLGIGKEATREQLLAGTSCVHAPEVLPTQHKQWPVGEVGLTNSQLSQLAGQSPEVELSRTALLGMIAAREAVADAGLSAEEVGQLMLVNGTTVGGMDLTERHYAEWLDGDYRHLDLIRQHEAGLSSEMIGHSLGVAGSTTVSTACSSALNALIVGSNMLRIGSYKRVLVGGTESLSAFHLNGFAALGILSQAVCRPFSPDRDGINLGEGAAYLVLEPESEARKRGATVYGYVAGTGNRCDAFHPTASSPDGEGAYLAMQEAISESGLLPDKVNHIIAHGTATPNNDASELAAIRRLFGDGISYASYKHLTGHTTSAAGSISAVEALLLMQTEGYQHVLVNAFGFGGNDSSLLLSSEAVDLPEPNPMRRLRATEMVVAAEDADYKPYISPMQARRLTPQMRRLVAAAGACLRRAGLERPDAIIVGTQWGGMVPSAQLLETLVREGEHDLSPALFMQSTHNAAAGMLAQLFGCKGYNITFSHGPASYAEADSDAAMQLMLGEKKNILVCHFDEVAPAWQTCLEAAEYTYQPAAEALLFTAE